MSTRRTSFSKAVRYECFNCGTTLLVSFKVQQCPKCGTDEDIYLMS